MSWRAAQTIRHFLGKPESTCHATFVLEALHLTCASAPRRNLQVWRSACAWMSTEDGVNSHVNSVLPRGSPLAYYVSTPMTWTRCFANSLSSFQINASKMWQVLDRHGMFCKLHFHQGSRNLSQHRSPDSSQHSPAMLYMSLHVRSSGLNGTYLIRRKMPALTISLQQTFIFIKHREYVTHTHTLWKITVQHGLARQSLVVVGGPRTHYPPVSGYGVHTLFVRSGDRLGSAGAKFVATCQGGMVRARAKGTAVISPPPPRRAVCSPTSSMWSRCPSSPRLPFFGRVPLLKSTIEKSWYPFLTSPLEDLVVLIGTAGRDTGTVVLRSQIS